MKKQVLCKQCGRPFVKYAYHRTARCEECRKADPAAHARSATIALTRPGETDKS
ncbi:MAG TPA: hypothetical protein PLM79_18495 [Syntrophobacteraceae bacterium]|nr:hypothetical protein [Syntrophobacteraceae bacterium]